jgi:hypothetical protein
MVIELSNVVNTSVFHPQGSVLTPLVICITYWLYNVEVMNGRSG